MYITLKTHFLSSMKVNTKNMKEDFKVILFTTFCSKAGAMTTKGKIVKI